MRDAFIIPIVYACNATYVPYLYISIASLVKRLGAAWKASIKVLHDDIPAEMAEQVCSLGSERVEIEFIDVRQTLKKYHDVELAVGYHFTKQTYYRFFLPELLPDWEHILYIDADTLVLRDVAQLFSETKLTNELLGVTRDMEIIRAAHMLGAVHADYFTQTLGVQPEEYFQAGVMLMNLEQMRIESTTQKLIQGLQKLGTPLYVDQDVLNMVCKGRVKYISQNWDFTWHLPLHDLDYREHLGSPHSEAYEKARQEPYIIHFTGKDMKPENYPMLPEARLFWEQAEASPYAELLRARAEQAWPMVQQHIKKMKTKLRKYRLLSKLPLLGKTRNKIVARRERAAASLEALRRCGVPV